MAIASVAFLHGQTSVLTWHNDNSRTGQNLQETILTPVNVNAATFGRLTLLTLDAMADAQLLYVPSVTIPGLGTHNVLYVATEHDSVYAFDADSFAQLLHVSLAGPGETPSDDRGCGQVTPEIGITATPAIDLNAGPHGTMYVIAMSKTAAPVYHQRLHALDLTTLAEQFNGPVEIAATFPGSGAENTFIAAQHVDRPGLLILNGTVYTAWGSHCDAPPYAGWVLSYNETTLQQTGFLNLVPNGSDGAVWQAGAGPAADANGNVYLLTGNGTFDASLNSSSFPAGGDYGNAFVKIATSGPLSVADYFTMTNTVSESGADTDLGSAGLILLPPLNNAQGKPVSLAVGAGKDRNIYVVDRSNMGKFNPSMDSIYQLIPDALPNGTWSSPAWFNGTLYYGGVNDSLKAYQFTNGAFAPGPQSANMFPYPGTTPSISANGTSGGIVWALDNATPAILHAYDAAAVSTELYNSNQAAGGRDFFGYNTKFIAPMIANGKVYVGTQAGAGIFGLLPAAPPASLSVAASHSGSFIQGQQGATYQVVVSNGASAGPTTGTVAVNETIPAGLTLVGMAGSGWNCVNGTCVRGDALAAGGSYPGIMVTVNVAETAPSSVTNIVAASGGSQNRVSNDATSDPTVIVALQSITFGGLGNQTLGAAPFTISATASSGLPVSFVSNSPDVCTISGNTVTLVAAGTCSITASQAGNANYAAAAPVLQSFAVLVVVTADSVTPSAGAGAGQSFTFKYSSGNGFGYLNTVYALWNSGLMGSAGCYVYYMVPANALYLVNDSGSASAGPLTPGGDATLQNEQCVLNGAGSAATGTGNTLTLTLSLSFKAAFGGAKNTYGLAFDDGGQYSSWRQLGTWTPNAPPPPPPTEDLVTPNTGAGASQSFSFEYSSGNGFGYLNTVYALWNNSLAGSAGCYVYYVVATNALYLVNDSGSGSTGPLTPGVSGMLRNSQCALSGSGSAAQGSGNMLSLTLSVSFGAAFSGLKNTYGLALDNASQYGEWQQLGTWTVNTAPALTADSVTPNAGTGASQSFTFKYSSVNGFGYLNTVYALWNSSLVGSTGCYVYYVAATNALYLVNDSGSGSTGPLTPGAFATLQNGQCIVNGTGSSAMGSADTLSLTLSINFNATFSGPQHTYGLGLDNGSEYSGWQQLGGWTPN